MGSMRDGARAHHASHDALQHLRGCSGRQAVDQVRTERLRPVPYRGHTLITGPVHASEVLIREFVRIYAKNPYIADQLATNYRAAEITPRQRRMLAAADQLLGVPAFFAGRLIGEALARIAPR